MASAAIIIPARYNSSRFEGKPLTILGGKTMISRVIEQCKESVYDVYVATDDDRILREVNDQCKVIYDPLQEFFNGTERVASAALSLDYDYIINVQGDMPDVNVKMIDNCVELLDKYHVSTVYTELPDQLKSDPNTVKCIIADHKVLWMGRGFTYGVQHLGVYGYRKDALINYSKLEKPLEENIEKLEQLRWLKNGYDIGISEVEFDGLEINTPEDAIEWNNTNYVEVWSI